MWFRQAHIFHLRYLMLDSLLTEESTGPIAIVETNLLMFKIFNLCYWNSRSLVNLLLVKHVSYSKEEYIQLHKG